MLFCPSFTQSERFLHTVQLITRLRRVEPATCCSHDKLHSRVVGKRDRERVQVRCSDLVGSDLLQIPPTSIKEKKSTAKNRVTPAHHFPPAVLRLPSSLHLLAKDIHRQVTAESCPCKFLVFKETYHQHARITLPHNVQEQLPGIVLIFLVGGDHIVLILGRQHVQQALLTHDAEAEKSLSTVDSLPLRHKMFQ